MTSAGLVVMPSSHRRESFLYRSSSIMKSTAPSAANDQYMFLSIFMGNDVE